MHARRVWHNAAVGDRPIFLLGILKRSGTNHLHDLLCLHPEVAAPAPIWEDHVLREAERLAAYAAAVRGRWSPEWGVGEKEELELLRRLGDGVLAFLRERAPGRRLVTRTPSVANLALFPRLFPDAKLVILVRDGRALVESGVRSFGWRYESRIRRWAAAARGILAFDAAQAAAGRHRIVKYEDLVARLEPTLVELLRFLELDASVYDFARASALPVRGSSTLRSGESTAVDWKPVARAADFDPLARAEGWSRALADRFDWLAGRELRALGYDAPPVTDSRWRRLRNRMLDLRWRRRARRRQARWQPVR
jgi:hypothetical protein